MSATRTRQPHANHENKVETNETSMPGTAAPAETIVVEIDSQQVTLPVLFHAGHTLTANQALVLDAAYRRQFINNQNAIGVGRDKAFKAATTDADRFKYAPRTADEIAKLYIGYEPNVSGAPRQSALERMRGEAAWRVFLIRVADHNKAVDAGEPGLFKGDRAGIKFILPRGEGAAEWREKQIALVLAHPAYTARVQEQLDLLVAERDAAKSKAAGTKAPTGKDAALADLD